MEQNIDQLSKDAEVAFRAGENDLAEQLYKNILEQQPDSSSAHYALGTIALQRNNLEQALNSLRRAQQLEPEAVDIAFNLANCFSRIGDRKQTLLQLQHATKYCKADPVFCPLIAELLIRLGEPAAAIQLLSRLEALLPKDQIILARAQAGTANWREAVNILRRLNEVTPNDAFIANELALAAGKLRDFETAINAFERYLRLITPTANDYLRFADILLIAQKADRCSQAIDRALELGEDRPEVYVMQARVARLNGNYDDANIALDKAIKRMPNHGQAWSIRAELASDEQLGSLITELQLELNKKDEVAKINHHHRALLHFAQADMQDRNGNYAEAVATFDQANQVQLEYLTINNNTYRPEHTVQMADRMIEGFNTDVFDQADAPIIDENRDIRPIFIVGMPRSGTTLVERILGQNKQVFNAGEQEAMEFVAADFHQKTAVGKLPQPSAITTRQWAALRTLYLEKLPEISKPIFTDKLPHNFRHVGLILKLFPDARVIQMHRNMQDVCLSIYTHAFSAGHNYANRWPDLKHFYSQCERLMKHWSSLHSPRVLDLKYENLVQNPEHYARQLVEFCGFDWDDSYLEFHQSVNKSFTFSEMQVRQPIAAKRVDRWRSYAEFIPELSEL